MEPMTMMMISGGFKGLGSLAMGESGAAEERSIEMGLKDQQWGIEQSGIQEETDIRLRMIKAAASINASAGASGVMASSGSIQRSQAVAKGEGIRNIFSSRTNTKMRIMENMNKQAQARARGKDKKRAGMIGAVGIGLDTAARIGAMG